MANSFITVNRLLKKLNKKKCFINTTSNTQKRSVFTKKKLLESERRHSGMVLSQSDHVCIDRVAVQLQLTFVLELLICLAVELKIIMCFQLKQKIIILLVYWTTYSTI